MRSLFELGEATLLPSQGAQREQVGGARVPRLRPLALGVRLLGLPLGLVEPSLEQQHRRVHQSRVPEMRRLAQLGGRLRVLLECRTHRLRRTRREDALEPVEPCGGDVLLVCPPPPPMRSPAQRAPACSNAARGPQMAIAREISAYADVAGSPMRSAIATASALSSSRGCMSQSSRRAPARRASSRTLSALSPRGAPQVASCSSGMILVSDAGSHPHEAPAVADRGPRELARRRACWRARSAASRNVAFATVGVAGATLCVAKQQEQLDSFGVVRCAASTRAAPCGRGERPPRTRAVAQPDRRRAARTSPLDRPDRRAGSRSSASRAQRAESRGRGRGAPRACVRPRRGDDVAATRGSPGRAPRT